MKMVKSMAMQKISNELVQKLLDRRVFNHNKRFTGVAGKKAEEHLIYESFNRGCFREKNLGEIEDILIVKAGFRRLKDYFYVLRNGYPRVGAEIIIYEDYDLLPKGHRMHSKAPTYHLVKYDYFTNTTDIDGFLTEIKISDAEI